MSSRFLVLTSLLRTDGCPSLFAFIVVNNSWLLLLVSQNTWIIPNWQCRQCQSYLYELDNSVLRLLLMLVHQRNIWWVLAAPCKSIYFHVVSSISPVSVGVSASVVIPYILFNNLRSVLCVRIPFPFWKQGNILVNRATQCQLGNLLRSSTSVLRNKALRLQSMLLTLWDMWLVTVHICAPIFSI